MDKYTEEFVLTDEDCPDKKGDQVHKRETWSGRFESLLSLVGFTVGIGNIWRFPYVCYRNGGGTFLIPFLIFLICCGCPLYYLEVCLGQFSGHTTVNIWSICPLVKGLGAAINIVSALFIWNYGLIMAWILYYLVNSFRATLPWTTCNNEWNTAACKEMVGISMEGRNDSKIETINQTLVYGQEVNSSFTSENNMTSANNYSSPALEFWTYNVLDQSNGIEEFGSIQWHLVAGLVVGWILTLLCLVKGIKSVGKVVYFTALIPYVLLTVLLIRGVTLDGAWDGLKLFFKIDLSRLAHGQIWVEAATQVFYSLGPAWGAVITVSSFNKFHHKALRDTVIVCFADTFTVIYGGIVVFSVIGFLAKSTNTPVDSLPFVGPGLAFIAYPTALSYLPLPQLWSVLFFLNLVFIGLDSSFVMTETLICVLVDINYSRLNRYRLHITTAVIFILIILAIPHTCSNGIYIFQLIDWYMTPFTLIFIAMMETIAVCWIYGAGRFSRDMEMMFGRPPSIILRLSWLFVTPVFLCTMFIVTVLTYSAPEVTDGYHYPFYTLVIGNAIALGPTVIFFLWAIWEIVSRKGTLLQRFRKATTPSSLWRPNNIAAEEELKSCPYHYSSSCLGRLKKDIL